MKDAKIRTDFSRGPLEQLKEYFPSGLYFSLLRSAELLKPYERIEELRLRAKSYACFTVGGQGKRKNFTTSVFFSEDELREAFNSMCRGSLYAYSESIIKGYVSLPSGIRVGVCGRASVEGGRIIGVYDISALNIRIPWSVASLPEEILVGIRANARLGIGTLIFSPPAQGKTTCLRSLCRFLPLGDEAMRVALVDTRDELSSLCVGERLSLDRLVGYPKAEGIRIATLFMNPEVIICDEIGGESEAAAILDSQNCGVPLIATAHAPNLSALMRRRGITVLHNARVFGSYLSLRIGEGGGFCCCAYSWEEADRLVCGDRLGIDIY